MNEMLSRNLIQIVAEKASTQNPTPVYVNTSYSWLKLKKKTMQWLRNRTLERSALISGH